MLKTLIKAVGLLVCLAWFNLVSAATMGGINVMSALGHPLKAEISLGDLGKNDKSVMVPRLASVSQFKGAGLDYPYSLPKLSFEVASRSNGEVFIKLSSTQPVNEPFVSILIELNWPSGRLLREYTFLLDPVGFVPEQPKPAEVKPVEPMIPAVEPAAPVAVTIPEPLPVEPADSVVVAPVAEENTTKSEPVMSDMAKAELAAAQQSTDESKEKVEQDKPVTTEQIKMEPLPAPQEKSPVSSSIVMEKGDTLGKVADDIKPVDVSLERMLVAMYRANTKQFDAKNMNRIRAGKILRVPDAAEIEKVTQAAAVKEIRAQVADWQAYRQKLAAAQTVTSEKEPKQEATGKVSAAVAEKAPVIKESAKEVLKLSKGESLGDKTVVGAATSKQDLLTAKADDAVAKSKQIQEEKQKLAQLETINKEASKLVELKSQAVPEKAPEEIKEKPAAKPAMPPVNVVPEQQPASDEFDIVAMLDSLVTTLMEDPLILGAGVAVLLGIGGLGFVLIRRKKGLPKKAVKKNDSVGELTGSWRTPTQPSPDTGDFTQAVSAPVAAVSAASSLDDVDPISEADLFLNFGRDAQAEEILKDALKKTPANVQVKLKLLSIYVARKDTKTFSKYAQEIKDSGDESAWERAAVMGREVDPSNPTYAGAKGEVRNREQPKAEVDFALDLDGSNAPGVAASAPQDFKMDFDLGASADAASDSSDFQAQAEKTMVASKPASSPEVDSTSILSRELVKAAEKSSPMDFDVSGILPGDVKNVADSPVMDFDVTGSIPSETQGYSASSSMDFDITGSTSDQVTTESKPDTMDFDITGGGFDGLATEVIEKPVVKTEEPAKGMDFSDLVFDIPTEKASAPEPAPSASSSEEMTFTLDFPGSDSSPDSGAAKVENKIDIDFGDINLNLDDQVQSEPSSDGKDEQWHEVATKLDLAKAYKDMGDVDGAREILEEVVRDGDASQREAAEKLLQEVSA